MQENHAYNVQVNICLGCMKNMREGQKICPSCGYDNSTRQNAEELLPEGTVLFRKYLIGRVIGRGGFGVTYVSYDLDLQLKVAIKEYFPIGICIRSSQTYNVKTASALEDSSVFSKGCDVFLDEARTLAKINSPYIVHVRDFFREHGTAYIVMDYAEGVTLKEEMKKNGGRLPPERVLTLMEPMMRELDMLHGENIIHRDIKPENIMLVRDRRGEHLMLLDFGSARTYVSKESKSLTSIVTQGFSPLEQYSSISRQGSYTDVYALCATIYNAITGEIPPSANDRNIDGVPLKSITDCGIMIAPEAEAAIMHGLALRSADRTQTMEQLLEELKGNSTAGGSRIGKEIRTEKSKQPSKVTTGESALKEQTGEQKAFSSKQMEARNEGKRQEKTSAAPKTALAVAVGLLLFTGIYFALTRNNSEVAKPEEQKETAVVSTETPSTFTPKPTSTLTPTPAPSPTPTPPLGSILPADSDREANAAGEEERSVSMRQDELNQLINARVGDYITFGTYEQDNNLYNGKEDIEWLVLEKENDRLFVISKYALDCQPYNSTKISVTWETCSLRKWLNEFFLYIVFNDKEQAMIPEVTISADRNPNYYYTYPGNATEDKIFLLSIPEATKYFNTNEYRRCAPTAYAIAQGAFTSENYKTDGGVTCWWWLRSPGHRSENAADVGGGGSIGSLGSSISNGKYAVRPALWINLES